MEDMANLERGTLEYIKVKKSTAFKAEGKTYKIIPGKYLLDRKKNYPLIFPFKLEEVKSTELNKDLMKKREAGQLKSFKKIGTH